MSIKALNDTVVLKHVTREAKSTGGILLGVSQEKLPDGEVVAISEIARAKLGVEVGDYVYFRPNSGHITKVDGQAVIVMQAEHITMKVEAR